MLPSYETIRNQLSNVEIAMAIAIAIAIAALFTHLIESCMDAVAFKF
jgi:hypothetical protein